jgi:hypothetical protein
MAPPVRRLICQDCFLRAMNVSAASAFGESVLLILPAPTASLDKGNLVVASIQRHTAVFHPHVTSVTHRGRIIEPQGMQTRPMSASGIATPRCNYGDGVAGIIAPRDPVFFAVTFAVLGSVFGSISKYRRNSLQKDYSMISVFLLEVS